MERQTFSSRLTTVLTMIGVAVGLGNVWRFPYMMGANGGSAFLLVFLIFALLFAIPAAMGEWSLGRITREGPPGAYIKSIGPVFGRIFGLLFVLSIFITESYYVLIISQVAIIDVIGLFLGYGEESREVMSTAISGSWWNYGASVVLLVLSAFVLLRGMRAGVERVSVWFVPAFGAIILGLIAYTLSLDGAITKFADYMKPDFAKVLSISTIFAAVGQAVFSLGLGGNFFVAYGSHIKDKQPIAGSAFFTGMGDVGAALMASLFVVPAVLVFGMEMGQGPSLVLNTLPQLFGTMVAGRLVGFLFLTSLVLMAFLSSLAALQVLLSALEDQLGISHRTAVWGVVIAECLMILPISLNPHWIGTLDMIFGSGMQTLGCCTAMVALTWGFGKMRVLTDIFGEKRNWFTAATWIWLKFLIPALLLVILVLYIFQKVSG